MYLLHGDNELKQFKIMTESGTRLKLKPILKYNFTSVNTSYCGHSKIFRTVGGWISSENGVHLFIDHVWRHDIHACTIKGNSLFLFQTWSILTNFNQFYSISSIEKQNGCRNHFVCIVKHLVQIFIHCLFGSCKKTHIYCTKLTSRDAYYYKLLQCEISANMKILFT